MHHATIQYFLAGCLAVLMLGCERARQAPTEVEVPAPATAVEPADVPAGLPPPPVLPEEPTRWLYPGIYSTTTNLPAKTAALTFDDGPGEFTPEFLDILAEKNVVGTFFVNSFLFDEYGLDVSTRTVDGTTIAFKDVLRRIVDDGHALANHTMHHPDLRELTPDQIARELESNAALVNRVLKAVSRPMRPLTLVRPPFGSPWNVKGTLDDQRRVAPVLARSGLNILWTVDSSDFLDWPPGEWWTHRGGTDSEGTVHVYDPTRPEYRAKVQRLIRSVTDSDAVRMGAGICVLMHDTRPATRDALGAIIDGLRERGYVFVTAEEMVTQQWGRPSAELTFGPHDPEPAVPERNRGCQDFSTALGKPPLQREHEVCGQMLSAFVRVGGSTIVGRPLRAAQLTATGVQTQWFENARVERDLDQMPPDEARLTDVGTERLRQLGTEWTTATAAAFQSETAKTGCEQVEGPSRGTVATRFNLCGHFLSAWRAAGETRTLGRPLSTAHADMRTGRWVQWFERGRLDGTSTESPAQLAPLGRELLEHAP